MESDESESMRPSEHVVEARDTLDKIAAQYNTTPSALSQFNRLSSRFIYAGQVLKIPPVEPPQVQPDVRAKKIIQEEPEIVDAQLLRINVRHLTDGAGIVLGSLLLTPKVIMFNPNVSDPVVEESSVDRFQIILPTELVVNLAIVDDFAKNSPALDPSLIFHPHNQPENPKMQDEQLKYLKLVMGKPIGKKLPRSSPIVSYGEQCLEPEYWFILDKSKWLLLYSFFKEHLMQKYGCLDLSHMEKLGLELISDKRNVIEDETGRTCNRATISKIIRKTLTLTSIDFASMAEMVGTSQLMSEPERLELARELPPRTDGCKWVLKFSTTNDGYSLNTLIRRLEHIEGPVLIILSDLDGAVFGAFLSDAPKVSDHFQGTGETFLFALRPSFQVFNWTGENNYFFRVDLDSLVVGSGHKGFGLWIDQSLNQGRSNACPTFDSQSLATKPDFTLNILECWAFEM